MSKVMNSKEFNKLTLWIDYDRPKLSRLSYPQQVDYFSKRLSLYLLKPLRDILDTIKTGGKASPLLIFATSVCCAIEALGKFQLEESSSKKDNFLSFLQYMNKDFRRKKIGEKSYGDLLWKYFRNGLAHSIAIQHGGFEHQETYFSIRLIAGKKCLVIDPESFYSDFKNAIEIYIRKLSDTKNNSTLKKNFIKIFKDVYIEGNN